MRILAVKQTAAHEPPVLRQVCRVYEVPVWYSVNRHSVSRVGRTENHRNSVKGKVCKAGWGGVGCGGVLWQVVMRGGKGAKRARRVLWHAGIVALQCSAAASGVWKQTTLKAGRALWNGSSSGRCAVGSYGGQRPMSEPSR